MSRFAGVLNEILFSFFCDVARLFMRYVRWQATARQETAGCLVLVASL